MSTEFLNCFSDKLEKISPVYKKANKEMTEIPWELKLASALSLGLMTGCLVGKEAKPTIPQDPNSTASTPNSTEMVPQEVHGKLLTSGADVVDRCWKEVVESGSLPDIDKAGLEKKSLFGLTVDVYGVRTNLCGFVNRGGAKENLYIEVVDPKTGASNWMDLTKNLAEKMYDSQGNPIDAVTWTLGTENVLWYPHEQSDWNKPNAGAVFMPPSDFGDNYIPGYHRSWGIGIKLPVADMDGSARNAMVSSYFLQGTSVAETAQTPTETAAPAVVVEGSEAAKMGIPVGSELGADGIYRKKAPTGVVEVGNVENGKITAEAFLAQKIYATAEEALQHKWPVDLVLSGKAGDACQLTAEPLPENVVTGKDVGFFTLQNPGQPIIVEELRWGSKEVQDYYDKHPEDLPVKFCGYAAIESPYDEPQKDYIAKVFQWENPDKTYAYITLLYNKAQFIIEDLGNRNLFWPKRYPLDIELNSLEQSRQVTANILGSQELYDLIGKWKDDDSVPPELQNHAIAGGINNTKAKK